MLAGAAGELRRVEMAGQRIADDAVAQAVVCIAGGERSFVHQHQVGGREQGLAVGVTERTEVVEEGGEGAAQIDCRLHRQNAVEVQGEALRRHQGLAGAVGTAEEIAALGCGLVVALRDGLLRQQHHVQRTVAVIQLGLHIVISPQGVER